MTREGMIESLREKGLKVTSQRLAVIDVLIEQRFLHPSAARVFAEATGRGYRLSLSTVYATLREFSRHGLIRTLEFDQMENRYELNLEEHINLICERCGRIRDYPVSLAVSEETLLAHMGFRVRRTRMEYYGCCRECLRGSPSRRSRGDRT